MFDNILHFSYFFYIVHNKFHMYLHNVSQAILEL